ncbi:MAG: hypothetical protein IJ662_09630 [Clostridia bacterium]|nr:hypothetical protein [Clostridia bacterium]
MKKSIWIILLVVIIAAVLIGVFAVQKDTLSTEVARLQSDKDDLTRQLEEVDMAVKTAQELAETMVQEAEDKLTAMTAERDTLQASAEAAATQLDAGIKQLKDTLIALGGEDAEVALNAELQETKDALTAMTAERDALIAAADAAVIGKTSVTIYNADDEPVLTVDDVNDLSLANLQPGVYTIQMTVRTVGGEEAAQYSFGYVAPEIPGEAGEEAIVEEAEEPAAEAEEAAEEPVETEAPVVEEAAEEAAPEEPAAEEAAPAEAAETPAEDVEEPADAEAQDDAA